MRRRNLRKDPVNRCLLCGLRTTLHFTPDNRKLTCDEAAQAHPHASVRPQSFAQLLTAVLQEAR
jgi:hypothetical protein